MPGEELGPCVHLVVEEGPLRRCLLCGVEYDRAEFLRRLERRIRDRWRLPPSPWTSQERAEDCW